MERNDWLMNEDMLEGRRSFILTILDEAGQPEEVIEGVENIKKVIKEYDNERDIDKSKASDRG